MTKRVSLDRLRDISRPRSIRRPPPVEAPFNRDRDEVLTAAIEWPVPG
jgi:hypothetical protein